MELPGFAPHVVAAGLAPATSSNFLRRLWRYDIDVDSSVYYIEYLLRLNPDRVYKLTYHQKQTRNQWSREDPGFTAIVCALTAGTAIAWGFACGGGIWGALRSLLVLVAAFTVGGALVATLHWQVTNKCLRAPTQPHAVEQVVEWGFCFDVHANSWVPMAAIGLVGHLLLLPLTLRPGLLPVLVANSVMAVAAGAYVHVTFRGFSILPFLDRVNSYLYPLVAVAAVWALSIALGWNASFLLRCDASYPVKLLDNVSATFPSGELTLVIAPPGAGKTTLLRTLSGAMEMKPTSELEQAMTNPPSAPVAFGEYTLGGKSALELGGSRVSRLVSRVVQDDEHYGLITVRETAELAVRLSNPPESPEQKTAAGVDPAETPAQEAARKAALLLEELGIDNVADTVLGNETVRGVSGGEAKRVTIMEALATPLRALVLDDASNGLDGARTKAIVAKLKEFARELRIPIVMALQQPSREVFDLFHRIVLMRHGRVLYEGPRDEAGAFLASIGLAPPSHQSVPDWLLEVASSPSLFSPSVAVLQDGARPDGLERFKFAPTLDGSRTGDPADSKASGKGGAARASPTEGKVDAGSDQSTSGVAVHLDEEGGLEEELASAASGRGELPGFDPLAAVQALPALTTRGISEHFYAKWAPARPAAGRPAGGRIPGVRLAAAAPVQHPKELAWPKSQATDLLFGEGYAADSCTQMGLLLWRDTMLMLRDTEFLATHLVNSVIVALLLGGVFYQLGQEDFQQYVSLIFFASLFLGMGNFSSLPVTIYYRAVADKQVLAGMYHPTLYALSQALVSIPIAVLETLIFISIVYWMCGFANDVGRFLIMAAMSLSINLFMAAYFRSVAWISGNAGFAAAQGMAIGPFALLMVTNGFVVTRENLSDALWWFSYVNPLAYGIRGLVVNEFSDPSYDNYIPIVEESVLPNGTQVTSILGTRRIGDAYLESYDMPTEDWSFWITLGFLVVLGEMLLCVAGGTTAYSCIRTYGSRGTAREENTKEEEKAARKISKRVIDGVASGRLTPEIEMARARSSPSEEAARGKASGASAGSTHGSSMVWDNVKYTVKLTDGSDKTLLHGISGWAKPGQITALLGESGAGKSTLLDCLAGRKNQGKLEGSILLDGKPATRDAINLVASYVEQFDHHVPQQTVREALEFSADLRLPAGTPASERAKVVERVLDLLELTSIQNSRIGLPGASGISAGERKRLSIAVELVSQPRIIFLDEPTTGLSSLQALGLMRALRRIADAGHSIVATVHQPSASIFFYMDRLLLLRRGGATVYFGPLGDKGSALIKYMESCKGVRPLPLGTNPADWMLEVVGEAGRASQGKGGEAGDIESKGETVPDLAVQFDGSQAANVMKAGLAALRSGEGLSAAPAAPEHPSWLQEFGVVMSRTATVSWRDVDYNTSRTIAVPFLATMFGLTFLQLDDVDQAGVFSVIGASFMGATFLAIVLLNLSIPPLMTVRPSLYRELDAGFFTPESWALATTLMEVPWVACLSAAFSAILYFMVGLDPANYGEFYATLLTLSLAMTMMGHAVAMGSGSYQTATAIAGSSSSIMFLFGGFLVTGPDMDPGWKWLHYIVPIRYGLAGLVTPAFHCPEEGLEGPDMPAGERGPCSTVTIVRDGQLQAGVVKSDYIDNFMGFRFDDIGFYTGMLVGYFVLFAALKMLLLRFVRHQSR